MSKRVHCIDCAYYVSNLYVAAECSYPDNVVTQEVDDWLSVRKEHDYIRKPYRINIDCNCEWHKFVVTTANKTGVDNTFPTTTKLQ